MFTACSQKEPSLSARMQLVLQTSVCMAMFAPLILLHLLSPFAQVDLQPPPPPSAYGPDFYLQSATRTTI